jgi:hypothetical protein
MKLARAETVIVLLALVVLGVLRWFSVYSHRWNTDEPQHLHVVWAWTVGLLQYRDVFDNHTPLFHILNAPLLHWLGERADIVLPMRRAMMPIFAVGIWCIYRLGTALYDRRTGWFAALLAALLPAFFFRMGEFRTDVMWTTVWLLVLVVALTGRLTPWRTFGAALLLGTAFAVSMKTTLLVLFVAVAGIITWLLAGRPIAKNWPAHLGAFVGGVLLVPGIIVGYFASQGALHSLYHCVIEHNTLPGQHLGKLILKQVFSHTSVWIFPVVVITWLMLPAVRREPKRGYRRLFLFLLTGLFYSILRGFWPVVTTQDYLPWLPLIPIFAVAGWTWLHEWRQRTFPKSAPWLLAVTPLVAAWLVWLATDDPHSPKVASTRIAYLAALLPVYLIFVGGWLWARRDKHVPANVAWLLLPALLLTGEVVWIVTDEPPLARVEERRIGHLAALLRLVDPGEYVLDTKGETIFRPRPTYLVLETLTIQQLQSGRLQDDTIPRLIATRTAVVRKSDRMLPATQRFIEKNYLRVNGGHALGQRLATPANTPISFEITIPESYGLVGLGGPVRGTLDGQPIDGPRWLDAGRHEVTVTQPAGEVILLWERAIERGYSPVREAEAKD